MLGYEHRGLKNKPDAAGGVRTDVATQSEIKVGGANNESAQCVIARRMDQLTNAGALRSGGHLRARRRLFTYCNCARDVSPLGETYYERA